MDGPLGSTRVFPHTKQIFSNVTKSRNAAIQRKKISPKLVPTPLVTITATKFMGPVVGTVLANSSRDRVASESRLPPPLMSSRVQRTYSRRNRSTLSSSSPPPEDPAPEPSTSSPSSTPPSSPIPKRSLSDALIFRPPAKRPRLSQPNANKTKPSTPSSKWKANPKKQPLIQLHFSIDASVLRKCPICDLSYTKGAQDDEALHKSHCARVQRGLEWTKDEIKESAKHGVVEIESGIRLKDGSIGRILAVNANVPGKIGSKVPFSPYLLNITFSCIPCLFLYVKT